MTKIALLLTGFSLVAALAALPGPAVADHCTGGEDALLAIPYAGADGAPRYALIDGSNAAEPLSFYAESNGKPGLQPKDGRCGSYLFLRADMNLEGAPL